MSQTIGILGAGQLGRMLALAGYPLGLRFRFLDPAHDPPAARLGEHIRAPFDDKAALARFAQDLTVVTYEFENVPASALSVLEPLCIIHPGVKALEVSQDRVAEKSLCRQLGISTATFAAVDSEEYLERALASVGLPAVLKTRRLGYDGKGQAVARDISEARKALSTLGASGLIAESFVPFQRELSIISARAENGEIVHYPLTENQHRLGILRVSRAPAVISSGLESEARNIISKVMEALNYVGVLTIELFEAQGRLLVNEMAPRVHNSGHWTIDGAVTSQFENHLRAILGLPLGSTEQKNPVCMFNFIGKTPELNKLLEITGCHVHLYGKSERSGRKLGHCTVVGKSPTELQEKYEHVLALIRDDG